MADFFWPPPEICIIFNRLEKVLPPKTGGRRELPTSQTLNILLQGGIQ